MTKEERDARKWAKAKYYQNWAVRQGLSKATINDIPDLVDLNAQDKKLFQVKRIKSCPGNVENVSL